MDEKFWNFSLRVYAMSGVQSECLELQDKFGIDINLLLFCAYLGALEKVALSEQEVAEAATLIGEWHRSAVVPLRGIRRTLKPMLKQISPDLHARTEELRIKVKAAELESEYLEQMMLARWHAQNPTHGTLSDPLGAAKNNVGHLFALRRVDSTGEYPQIPIQLLRAAIEVSRQV